MSEVIDLEASIARSFERRLEAGLPDVAINFDNAKFQPPKDNGWLRLVILFGDQFKADVLRRVRAPGVAMIQVFYPVLKGTRAALQLAGRAKAVFMHEGQPAQFDSINCRVPSILRVGDTGDGWFQYNVSVPYFRDATL